MAMSKILMDGHVNAVALCNTFPKAMVIDRETLKSIITVDGHWSWAGASGSNFKPLVVGTVLAYRLVLDEEISIIAEMGIWTGWDIMEYSVVGADFFRVATMRAEKGDRVFQQLIMEFIKEMETRGFESFADIPRLGPIN